MVRYAICVFIALTFVSPAWQVFYHGIDLHADWRTARRDSAHIAPDPKITKEAIIQVYSAPAFNWRKIFSTHTWIAVKPKDADAYTVFQVIGWRLFALLPPLVKEKDIPDRYWFNEKPMVILDIRGQRAEELIPRVMAAADKYPYANSYELWPGPNSNTFTAYIARQVPELRLTLPSNAIGKDYLPHGFFARSPSGTGYQLSIYGVFGIMLAVREGLEINFLSFVYGVSPYQCAVKLPGVGDVGVYVD